MTTEIVRLRAVNSVYKQLSTQLDSRPLLTQFAHLLVEQFSAPHVVILTFDKPTASLEYGASSPMIPDRHTQTLLEMVLIPILNTDDTHITALKQGSMITVPAKRLAHSRLAPLTDLIPTPEWLFVPLHFENQWLGIIGLGMATSLKKKANREMLHEMCSAAAQLLHNANQHVRLRLESEKALSDMQTFQQIDEELNDTIDLSYVFRMILDWALRFTRADTAMLGLYDEAADTLEVLVQYGYSPDQVTVGQILKEDGGITGRVARQGRAEMIPDVTMDKDYYPTTPPMRSMMAVPILREERVVAVMALESSKVNGFSEEHLTFALKLANRAGVSVQNARLYSETQRERHKLSLILRHIADIVMVLDAEQRIVMLNRSAIQVFGLDEQRNYEGDRLSALIPDSPLIPWLTGPDGMIHPKDASLRLPNNRIYSVTITRHPDIGQMIVLQDITYYKEMDQLKSELVTTVSHDLKQPLSIMRGYLDLLGMVSESHDARTKRYISNLEVAFNMMRQLIDDLLDMARIEEGIQLELYPVTPNDIIQSCLANFASSIEERDLTLDVDLPRLPLVEGDIGRLTQVFQNLISNAIKYTPPQGMIRIWSETTPDSVQINIQDSGIGISPEDQAHIFERFFRVRNNQTAKIEGTGLGLAIVQSLVQAHGGTIRVESERDEGSTFKVSLPIYKTQHQRQEV